MKYKSISCICLTYGRPHLLVESLYSYLIQEYEGESELLIVNDAPFQKYYFTHDNVRVINLDTTFSKWGAKSDFAIRECKYDICAVWDDDDIAIQSNHLSNIDKYFTEGTALLHWHNAAFMMGDEIAALRNVGNSGIVFSKDAWRTVGGYPHENCGADTTFTSYITFDHHLKVIGANPSDNEISWAYRWGKDNYNCSGLGADWGRPEEEQIISRHVRHIDSLRKQGNMPEGDIYLKPTWNKNYTEILKEYILRNK